MGMDCIAMGVILPSWPNCDFHTLWEKVHSNTMLFSKLPDASSLTSPDSHFPSNKRPQSHCNTKSKLFLISMRLPVDHNEYRPLSETAEAAMVM